jgi:hypothetical protein
MHFPSKYIGIEMYYVGHLPDTDIRSNAKTLRDIFHQNRSNLLLFLLTKHQNIFVINLQNRYIYDLLDCISLIALFKIIRTYIFFMLITVKFINAPFSKKLNRKYKCANMVTKSIEGKNRQSSSQIFFH